jgi:hypothetical protein
MDQQIRLNSPRFQGRISPIIQASQWILEPLYTFDEVAADIRLMMPSSQYDYESSSSSFPFSPWK